MSSEFTLPRLERVISGAGALEMLPGELERHGCAKVLVVTGATLSRSPLLVRLKEACGSAYAATFERSRQHVPASAVDALLDAARATSADALVSFGGGSPIDTAKAVVARLLGTGTADPPLVHIAIPTTLSAGEFTDVAGVTHETTGVKHAVSDPRLAPRSVIADPGLTLETPDWLWSASGIRALDHAVETLYSARPHPISVPLAQRAIEMLFEHLPASRLIGDGTVGAAADAALLAHRDRCQMAAWLAVFGITNAGFGLSHVLGHQIGPRWNVAHGFTSSIMLPHAMRFMAEVAPERFRTIAAALGDAGRPPLDGSRAAALACVDRVSDFIDGLSLPRRLRDVGVPADGLEEVASVVHAKLAGSLVLDRPVSRRDIEELLCAAY